MLALNPMRRRRAATDDLRRAVDSMPRATKIAMLHGLECNHIIAGAYSNENGICPMLAAHRAGGRTNFAAFARTWDRFAERRASCRGGRRATERELRTLRCHLLCSLLDEDGQTGTLTGAIAAHHELAARHARTRPGDPDRRRELERTGGWAWTRLFRRYDDYAAAVRSLESQTAARTAAGWDERGALGASVQTRV